MHVGWTADGIGVLRGLDDAGDGPRSVRGELMAYEEVQIAGDGELIQRSPYQAWRPEDTKIRVYVLSPEPIPVRQGWTCARTVKEARAHCRATYGDILEEHTAGDHLFLRVRKA